MTKHKYHQEAIIEETPVCPACGSIRLKTLTTHKITTKTRKIVRVCKNCGVRTNFFRMYPNTDIAT